MQNAQVDCMHYCPHNVASDVHTVRWCLAQGHVIIAIECNNFSMWCPMGSLQSLDWTGGLDWWTGLVDWTGGLV